MKGVGWDDGSNPLSQKEPEPPMFRAYGPGPSLWESVLPDQLLALPEELARVDKLLGDPAFFEPFRPYFHPRVGRKSVPVETFLRLMYLKYRHRLGYESLCREVADSISWQRFCRLPLLGRVPDHSTLKKTAKRCGPTAVEALNEALLEKAAENRVLKTNRLRAGTTCVPADVAPDRQRLDGERGRPPWQARRAPPQLWPGDEDQAPGPLPVHAPAGPRHRGMVEAPHRHGKTRGQGDHRANG